MNRFSDPEHEIWISFNNATNTRDTNEWDNEAMMLGAYNKTKHLEKQVIRWSSKE